MSESTIDTTKKPVSTPKRKAGKTSEAASKAADAGSEKPEVIATPAKASPTAGTKHKKPKPAARQAVEAKPRETVATPRARSSATGKDVSRIAAFKRAQRPNQETVDRMVAEAAYYLAEKRNFAPGFEEEDWLAAKAQILAQLEEAKNPLAK
ncbi:DUF2934 domain-containing protein [Methylocaldum sp.]|uniref:DUF2934 domain-containing protein n=1 Tax=Methylocaldum sp. TaxID=1969727 RepID=UPI002D59AA04|nr:DUF2934 domain-containing protein [Methylocaldum sp.]HYE33890.1 DUF2934 domain-containing protein [Methylocaldum sp.]